jgi:hypothetical protein
MMNNERHKAKSIQESIRQILLHDWDPIGVKNVPEAQDEYDSYIGGVYRLLASRCSADQLIDHLFSIESESMGMPVPDRELLRGVANQLIALDISLLGGS